eukprot:7127144-Prorocentrum_lima.AAC.1
MRLLREIESYLPEANSKNCSTERERERYKELKYQYNQEKVKCTELRKSLADLHARKTPSPGTPSPTAIPVERT